MQACHFFQKRMYPFPIIITVILSAIIFISCNSNKKKEAISEQTSTTSSESFKMNCVILTKAQIQNWVDSGWTNPANPNRIKNLLLQFYTGNASMVNNNMQLIVYPGRNFPNVYMTGKKILSTDSTCVAKTITGPVIFGNNSVSLKDLKIVKADGSLDDFDYIRFIPAQNFPPYINFTVEIVRVAGFEALSGKGTWPCPPYCSEEVDE